MCYVIQLKILIAAFPKTCVKICFKFNKKQKRIVKAASFQPKKQFFSQRMYDNANHGHRNDGEEATKDWKRKMENLKRHRFRTILDMWYGVNLNTQLCLLSQFNRFRSF